MTRIQQEEKFRRVEGEIWKKGEDGIHTSEEHREYIYILSLNHEKEGRSLIKKLGNKSTPPKKKPPTALKRKDQICIPPTY